MKRTVSLLTLVVFGVLTLASFTSTAKASINVGTFNAITGNPQNVFSVGEDVRVIATASDTPITVVIFFETDLLNPVFGPDTENSLTYDKVISGITTQVGTYRVVASSAQFTINWRIDVVMFNVIPEAPFGTATLAIASLGAFGAYGLVRRRKTTYI